MMDLLAILLLFGVIFQSNRWIARRYGPSEAPWVRRSLDRLYVYHCIFTLLFPLLPGDAIGYWKFTFQQIVVHSDYMWDYFGTGTVFLLFLDFIPAKVLGLSFLTGNFLYGALGFIGLRYLFLLYTKSLDVNVRILNVKVIPYIFYLPNVHFWSAGIGKDTLCFFGIACFLYALYFYKKRFLWLFISVALVYFVRPHIAIMMLAGAAAGVIFSRDMKPVYRFLFLGMLVATILLIYKQVAVFLKVDELNVASFQYLTKDKAAVLNSAMTGSGVDMTSYPLPLRIFTYLYRPLFFDVHNVITFVSSIENLAYLIITVQGIRSFRARDLKFLPMWLKAGFVIFLLCLIVFSNGLGNLGIIMREKNMSMIYLILVCVWWISRRKAESLGLIGPDGKRRTPVPLKQPPR